MVSAMFEITIKEITTETKTVHGEHTVIDRRPYTDAELEESKGWMSSNAGKAGETKPIYGYAPDVEKEVETEHEILKQRVSDMDLRAVILAINKV
jgi:hypothetical protein